MTDIEHPLELGTMTAMTLFLLLQEEDERIFAVREIVSLILVCYFCYYCFLGV